MSANVTSLYVAVIYILCLTSFRNVRCSQRALLRNVTSFAPDDRRSTRTLSGGARGVRFGMPLNELVSSTDCARNWARSGWDADLVYILATHTKETNGCVQVSMGQEFPNGTFIGGIKDLAEGEVDFYGVSRFQEVDLLNHVGYLYPHKNENFCFMVPKLLGAPSVYLPPLSGSLLVVTGSFLTFSIVTSRGIFGLSVQRAALYVIRAFVTGQFHNRHRLVMVWVSIFGFFVVNIYNGSFVGSLMAPERPPDINTLAEVNDKIQIIYSSPDVAEPVSRIREKDDKVVFAVSKKVRTVRNPDKWPTIMPDIISTGSAILATVPGLDIFERFPEATRDGISLFHRVPECALAQIYYSFLVRKHWELHDRYSSLLQRIQETGIVLYLYRVEMKRMKEKFNFVNLVERTHNSVSYEPFLFVQFLPHIKLWVIGVAVATLVFLVELCSLTLVRRKSSFCV